MIRFILLGIPVCLILGLQACQEKSKAQLIIDHAIEAHGGTAYESAKISFDFREIHYNIMKTPSRYEYSREFRDSLGNVLDVLNNDGFSRFIDGKETDLSEERVGAYTRSVNSVAYFALLPYGLNDPAVQKEWIKTSLMEGQDYDVIKVSFTEEGGGEDFDDEFLYWINKVTKQMDFFAYTYHTDGGGIRFRKAINKRRVKGILFQDYLNFKPVDERLPLAELESYFLEKKLELFTKIGRASCRE